MPAWCASKCKYTFVHNRSAPAQQANGARVYCLYYESDGITQIIKSKARRAYKRMDEHNGELKYFHVQKYSILSSFHASFSLSFFDCKKNEKFLAIAQMKIVQVIVIPILSFSPPCSPIRDDESKAQWASCWWRWWWVESWAGKWAVQRETFRSIQIRLLILLHWSFEIRNYRDSSGLRISLSKFPSCPIVDLDWIGCVKM